MQEHHDGTWIVQRHATVKTNASMGMLVKASDVPNERASAAHQLVVPVLGFIMKLNCHLHSAQYQPLPRQRIFLSQKTHLQARTLRPATCGSQASKRLQETMREP